MLIWGVCWGAFFGTLWAWQQDWPMLFGGALLGGWIGALFAWSLRRAWRQEEPPIWVADTTPAAPVAPAPQPARKRILAAAPVSTPAPPPPSSEHQQWGLPDEAATRLAPAPDVAEAHAAAQAEAHAAGASVPPTQPAQQAQAVAPDFPVQQPPAWLQALQNWLAGGNAVVRLGFFLLFIGLAFLAKFAADAGLFPPPLRMAGLAAFGAFLLGLGWRLRQKARADDADAPSATNAARRLAYAYTLQGAGVAVLYLSIFSAYRLYGLLTPQWAFVLLAVVCAAAAALALLQNAAALAFIGFAGGYAAPILLSTGSNAIGSLLAYYLLLNVGVVVLAYARAWRALNLLGFFASFGVLSLWVAQHYQPSDYTQVQPFVLLYFALYVLAALFYALRHRLAARVAVDATLVFGLPTVCMGLEFKLMQGQAYGATWAALAMALWYAALAFGLQPKAVAGGQTGVAARWLRQSYAALALVLFTVALALGLDAPWTAAMWALEGLAVYWIGSRQGSAFARGMGLALQGLAAWVFVDAHMSAVDGVLLHPRLWGLLVLALSAWGVCALLQKRLETAADDEEGWVARWVSGLEQIAAPPLFLLACLWWLSAGVLQITYSVPQPGGYSSALIARAYQSHSLLLFFALSAWGLHHWARSSCAARLPIAALPLWLLLPMMLGFAYDDIDTLDFFTQKLGWLVWPVALALYGHGLRRLDGSAQGQYQSRWALQHYGAVLLLYLLLWQLQDGLVQAWALQGSAFADALPAVLSSVVLLVLVRTQHFVWRAPAQQAYAPWPWPVYGGVYLRAAAGSLALLLIWQLLQLAVGSTGAAPPLAYLPLLNPTDATVLLGLAALALYRRRWQQHIGAVPQALYGLLALGFVTLNTVWLRVVHHYWGVAWQADALLDSFVTQAGYSILWTLLALGLMLWAARGGLRRVWLGGAALLGITVAKLFLVDLSNSGGAERIISFIAVGGLMLVLGYFAPLPKAQDPDLTEAKML